MTQQNNKERIEKTKIQCKDCKKFFKNDFCDVDGNWEILNDKENNPNQLCVTCLDIFMTGKDRRLEKRWNDCAYTINERLK